ncbi:hypothetical protein AB9W56_004094 [Vibrio vulnificus]
MKKIFIVSGEDGFFAQNLMPWSSLNLKVIKGRLEDNGYDVSIITFRQLQKSIGLIKNAVIIYTSSQRDEHKRYIEDIVFYYNEHNILIPSFESLKAHDNKGFQMMLNSKYSLGLIDCNYFPSFSEVENTEQDFPCVYKPANGASSMGVEIVKNVSEVKRLASKEFSLNKENIKKYIKKYILRSRYNEEWERYKSSYPNRFVLQKLLPGLDGDYKVLIFGDKFYVIKRFTKDGDFRASGSGIHSRNIEQDDLNLVLGKALDVKRKYKSHIYSLDICIYNGEAFLIEFQFTHVGPLTLIESDFYYIREGNGWKKVVEKSNLEHEFCNSVESYI